MQSYHNFLFPFRFDKIVEKFDDRHEFYKENTFDERVVIDENFKNSLEKDGWNYEKFEVKNHLDYNELTYFYDFAKDALFNIQEFQSGATSYYFVKQNIVKEYNIKTKDKLYKLKLTNISLRVFDTGVTILSFEVENHKYRKLQDILNINEFGRRIYPQFLSEGFSTKDVKEAFLPEYMEVNGITESFTPTQFHEIQLASFILETLGSTFTTKSSQKNSYFIQPLLDDRMFTVSWYGNNIFSNSLQNNHYAINDNWYKYVFIDKNKTIHSQIMQEKLITQATYDRWMNYQWGLTLYGMTRYSFVALTDSSDFSQNILLKHMQTLYFQMITLLLAQRGSILRFSDEIAAISDIDPEKKELTNNISNLYKHYLRFKNKLYFKEITPQEQGIELYDKARENMRIDSDIADLSTEIQSLNNYAFILDEKKEKEQMNELTKLGTIFLPGTFVAGVFGMNVFPDDWIKNVFGFALAFGGIFGLSYYLAKINNINILEFFKRKK